MQNNGLSGPTVRGGAYVLGLLMVVGLFNYMDRQSISILQVPIKRDLGLTDTQLGAITGLSFSILYATLAMPIARLADRTSRKLVIAAALAVWSVMTAACGLANGFWMLVLLRMGVAIGEAGCIPASQALISDIYPPHRRATALATWQLIFPIGTLVGISASGWLSVVVGWRHAFMLLGGLGVLLAPVVLLALREPRRERRAVSVGQEGAMPFGRALGALWALPAFRGVTIAGALSVYPLHAALNWNAPFYSRVFGLSIRELSVYLALLAGGAGGIGIYLGGFIADRLGRTDARWYARAPGIAALCVAPAMLAQYFSHDPYWSLALGVAPIALMNAVLPPQAAAAQALVGTELRALAAGVQVLASGLFATALGPFVTGLVSDQLATRFGLGADSLRFAIASSSVCAILGGWAFLRAARHMPLAAPVGAAPLAMAPAPAGSLG